MKHLISVPENVVPHFHKIAEVDTNSWFAASDPKNKKVGSGGGTAHILSELFYAEKENDFNTWLPKEKRVIIHAGGQSRRLPAYAAIGKSLLPMPVFRWSRGQHLNQRLIHLQYPLFDKLIQKAPAKVNTLIASGDTLIYPGENIPKIPDADVVCLGLWLEPEKATNHGVFFAQHDTPEKLEFMLQKPSIPQIQELVNTHYFLMDIGVWLLSDKAIKLLMKNCGWHNSGFKNTEPDYYDLYSEFGTALGTNPSESNAEVNDLSVALLNLDGGDFYHMGNTSELISSNLKIQNRINDQREIWHKNIKPQASIFVLNSDIKNNFTHLHSHIWVENSSIPDTWTFTQNNVLTGIPFNNWSLKLENGNCLDMVPVNNNETVLRNYGYTDTFRGSVQSSETSFMGITLVDWLKKRKLDSVFAEAYGNMDIFNAPLFPVIDTADLDEAFIQWLLAKDPEANDKFTERWLKLRRLSCNEIGLKCNIEATEQSRLQNRIGNYRALLRNYKKSVFYQLDLKKTAEDFVRNKIKLPENPLDDSNGWTKIHDPMFRSHVNRLKGIEWKKQEQISFERLRSEITTHFQKKCVDPQIDLLSDQIAWGRSPVRLDLAGGWTDTPPYCFLYGGSVVNVAVELNGQPPLQCYVKRSEKPEIVLRSIDLGAREIVESFDDLRSFQNIQSAFSIPKAALALCGFLPEFSVKKYESLPSQLEELGSGLEVTILSAVPKGSGLGTSSILAATVLGTLSEVCRLKWDKHEIGQRTLALEQMLTTGGGWQDQFGGLFDGIKLLETNSGTIQNPSVKWVPESLFADAAYKNRILLYYTGITRVAKNILAEIVRGMFLNSQEHLLVLEELKLHAKNTYNQLLRKDFETLASMINHSWELNQKIDKGTNTPEIQKLIATIQPYIISQKLLGAGGGGFMLMMAKSNNDALMLKKQLNEFPVNSLARFVDFQVSDKGFVVTKS